MIALITLMAMIGGAACGEIWWLFAKLRQLHGYYDDLLDMALKEHHELVHRRMEIVALSEELNALERTEGAHDA